MAMTEEKKKALWKRISSPAFWVAMIGACKVVLDAFGIPIITDDEINAVSNALATICIMVGITIGYVEEK